MIDETAPKDLRNQAPRLFPACSIENDAQALQAVHEVAGLAHREVALRDRERRLPWQELEFFTRFGLGGIGISRAHGGAQVSYVTSAEVFRVTCVADSAFGQIPQNQFGLLSVTDNVVSPAQKRKLFRGILDGRRLVNTGPERNTHHILELKVRVRRDGDGYRASGEKFYSTGALFTHWVTVEVISEEERAVMLFIGRGAPGLCITDDRSGFDQRATVSGTVLLDEVPVAGDMLIHNGLLAEIPSLQGVVSRLIRAAIDAGVAQAALDDAQTSVRERSRSWIDAQVERASDEPYSIAEASRLQIELHAADALLGKAGQVLDEVATRPVDAESTACILTVVAEVKVLSTEISLAASEKLFEPTGSRATSAEFNLDRYWRNARIHTLHDPVRWEAHAVGDYYPNGARPARHSWI